MTGSADLARLEWLERSARSGRQAKEPTMGVSRLESVAEQGRAWAKVRSHSDREVECSRRLGDRCAQGAGAWRCAGVMGNSCVPEPCRKE